MKRLLLLSLLALFCAQDVWCQEKTEHKKHMKAPRKTPAAKQTPKKGPALEIETQLETIDNLKNDEEKIHALRKLMRKASNMPPSTQKKQLVEKINEKEIQIKNSQRELFEHSTNNQALKKKE